MAQNEAGPFAPGSQALQLFQHASIAGGLGALLRLLTLWRAGEERSVLESLGSDKVSCAALRCDAMRLLRSAPGSLCCRFGWAHRLLSGCAGAGSSSLQALCGRVLLHR